jgi:hypothetical protein
LNKTAHLFFSHGIFRPHRFRACIPRKH